MNNKNDAQETAGGGTSPEILFSPNCNLNRSASTSAFRSPTPRRQHVIRETRLASSVRREDDALTSTTQRSSASPLHHGHRRHYDNNNRMAGINNSSSRRSASLARQRERALTRAFDLSLVSHHSPTASSARQPTHLGSAGRRRRSAEVDAAEETRSFGGEDLSASHPLRSQRITLGTILIIAAPLVASLLLTVVGVITIMLVNRHYAAETGETFPSTLVAGVSTFLRREIETELAVPFTIHSEIAAQYRSGLMTPPVRNRTHPTAQLAKNSTALAVEYARRGRWQRQASAQGIRAFQSTPGLNTLQTVFISNAQTRWNSMATTTLGNVLRGLTDLGDDIQLADGAVRPDAYAPSSAANSGVALAASMSSSPIPIVSNLGYSSYAQALAAWRSARGTPQYTTDEDRRQALAQILRPYLSVTLVRNSRSYVLSRQMTGPILDLNGDLVGVTDMTMDFGSIGEALERFGNTFKASSEFNANIRMTSFILSEASTVLEARGATSEDLLQLRQGVDGSFSWSNNSRCVWVNTVTSDYEILTKETCERTPAQFDKDPVIRASAPFLPSLCGDGSPLLGVGQRVTLRVTNGRTNKEKEERYAIVCEPVAFDHYNYLRSGADFSSWRIVTIVAEEEIVGPLSKIMPGTNMAAGIGIGVAGVAAVVAGIVAFLLAKSAFGRN